MAQTIVFSFFTSIYLQFMIFFASVVKSQLLFSCDLILFCKTSLESLFSKQKASNLNLSVCCLNKKGPERTLN